MAANTAEDCDGSAVADVRPAVEPSRSRHGKSVVAALSALAVSVATIVVAVPIVLAVAKSGKVTASRDNGTQQNLRAESKSRPDVIQPKTKIEDTASGDKGIDNATIATFGGNISDFIAPSTTRMSPTSSSSTGCPIGEGQWMLTLVTDDYPWETRWELYDGENEMLIAFGPPEGRNYDRRTKYVGRICLPSGDYYMRWHDLGGDSICCDYGPGEWTVGVNGDVVLQSEPITDSGFLQKDHPFVVGGSIVEADITGTFLIMPRPYNYDLMVELSDGTTYEMCNVPEGFDYAGEGLVSGITAIVLPAGTVVYSNGTADMNGEAPRSVSGRLLVNNVDGKSTEEDRGGLRASPGRRSLSSAFEGTRTVLAVRVVAFDGSTSLDETSLSDSIFGNGLDPVNLVSQFEACSYGKLKFTKAQNRTGQSEEGRVVDISEGVVTISLPFVSAAQGDGSEQYGTMRNAITRELNSIFDVVAPMQLADYVVYCLPPGAYGRIAYAYINNWLSVFNDDWCASVSLQMHELGHDMNMGHSNENGTTYEDQVGIMGASYRGSDAPRICFNAAKSWQTGWYRDKSATINSNEGGTNCFDGILHGIADYSIATTVLLKVQDRSALDYYVGFNARRGMNVGTQEAGDLVTVVSRPRGGRNSYSESELVAKLASGDSYDVRGYAISVSNIDAGAGTAQVKVLPTEARLCV